MDRHNIADNLRRLRRASNLSQQKLAEAAGISLPAYRNIETGTSLPKVTTLQSIATALGSKLSDLLRPITVLHGVRFRAQKKMATRDNILSDVSRWLEDYNELEQLVGDEREYTLVPLAEELRAIEPGHDRAVLAAKKAREQLDLGPEDAIRDIAGLVESAGIKLFPMTLRSEGFFGLSVAHDAGGPAILVNTWDRISVERWIFTVAHELGHLLLHLDTYDFHETLEDECEEREANVFASHFLMPESLFTKEWAETRGLPLVDQVLKLKRIFRVSYKTVLYRLVEGGLYDNSVWGRFQVAYRRKYGRILKVADEPDGLSREVFMASANLKSQEPEGLVPSDFVPDRRYHLVRLALEKELITMSRAADNLGVDLDTMRAIAASWVS